MLLHPHSAKRVAQSVNPLDEETLYAYRYALREYKKGARTFNSMVFFSTLSWNQASTLCHLFLVFIHLLELGFHNFFVTSCSTCGSLSCLLPGRRTSFTGLLRCLLIHRFSHFVGGLH